jgi:hypothetical protein
MLKDYLFSVVIDCSTAVILFLFKQFYSSSRLFSLFLVFGDLIKPILDLENLSI